VILKHEPKAEAVIAKLQSKVAVQRNEIARLTQLVERLMDQRDSLTKDLKWMRGEK
jgi:RNase P protein component